MLDLLQLSIKSSKVSAPTFALCCVGLSVGCFADAIMVSPPTPVAVDTECRSVLLGRRQLIGFPPKPIMIDTIDPTGTCGRKFVLTISQVDTLATMLSCAAATRCPHALTHFMQVGDRHCRYHPHCRCELLTKRWRS